MGIGKFDPLPPRNPLTDRNKKFAWVIMSGYLWPCKILRRSDMGFESEHARFCASLGLGYFSFLCNRYIQSPTAKTRAPIFTQNTLKYAVSHKDVPFGGRETSILNFNPLLTTKPIISGADFRLFSPKTALTLDRSRVSDP